MRGQSLLEYVGVGSQHVSCNHAERVKRQHAVHVPNDLEGCVEQYGHQRQSDVHDACDFRHDSACHFRDFRYGHHDVRRNRELDDGRTGEGQVEIVSPCAVSPCLSSLVSALSTSHAITLSGLNANTLYTYRILSKDASNNLATSTNQTFTTLASGGSTYSLWNNSAAPTTANSQDARAIEVGVKFKSDIGGAITAIRFYKGSQNTGTHNVSLWDSAGVLLGRALSSGETASGWQTVNFLRQ